jgi:hypothetical protein
MDFSYCNEKCPIGKQKSEEFLKANNSAYDAFIDFRFFADECYKTCPYKNNKHELKVCCISAKARHGKDTAAELLKEYLEHKGQRVLIIHFADLLKFICKQFFGWDGNKDEAGRTLLQYIGTDVVGAKKPEYWAKFVVDFLRLFENEWDYVFIPDWRYPIESATLSSYFYTLRLRIERPGFESNLTPEQKQHASEVSLDDYCFDAIISNNGSLEDFKEKLIKFADTELLN